MKDNRRTFGRAGLSSIVVSLAAAGCSAAAAGPEGQPGTPASDAPDAGSTSSDADTAPDAAMLAGDGPSSDAPGADASTSTSLSWFPGNYVMLNETDAETTERDGILANPAMAPFVGIEKRYDWTACEVTQGDYSPCIANVLSDLAAVDAIGKKLIVVMQYKTFDTSVHAVPAYLRTAGSSSCAGGTCGELALPSGGNIAMLWQSGVADRMHAWIAGVATGIVGKPHASALAAIVFPETSCPGCDTSNTGYTAQGYLQALEDNATQTVASFPSTIVLQYLNFIPPGNMPYLQNYADFALATPHVGVGCPDLGSLLHLPEYPVLEDARYQGRIPIAPAVEPMDYLSTYTASLAETYSLGIGPSPTGMGAQIIGWWNSKGASDLFTIDDVAAYIAKNRNPNVSPPSW